MITFDLILVLGRKSIEIKMGIPCESEAVPATVSPVPEKGSVLLKSKATVYYKWEGHQPSGKPGDLP